MVRLSRATGAALGECDEGVEVADAVCGCGGRVAADGAELGGAGNVGAAWAIGGRTCPVVSCRWPVLLSFPHPVHLRAACWSRSQRRSLRQGLGRRRHACARARRSVGCRRGDRVWLQPATYGRGHCLPRVVGVADAGRSAARQTAFNARITPPSSVAASCPIRRCCAQGCPELPVAPGIALIRKTRILPFGSPELATRQLGRAQHSVLVCMAESSPRWWPRP